MSNDTKRVNVVYGLKSDEFTKNLTEMKKQIQLTGSELQLAGQKVNTYGANLVNLGEKQSALNTQIKNVTNQMKLYDDSIAKNIEGEKMYTWTGNVGLANVSDILRASTNPLCTSVTTSYNGTNECNSNYLLDKGVAISLYYWTINASSSESGGSSYRAWLGCVAGSVAAVRYGDAFNSSFRAPRPVVFLKSSTTLNGSGTSDDPFTIV